MLTYYSFDDNKGAALEAINIYNKTVKGKSNVLYYSRLFDDFRRNF